MNIQDKTRPYVFPFPTKENPQDMGNGRWMWINPDATDDPVPERGIEIMLDEYDSADTVKKKVEDAIKNNE